MNAAEAIEYQWPYLRSFLPSAAVLEHLAASTGALVRRRSIGSADTLLRLALMYGFCGFSLRQTAAWADTIGLVSVSDVALLKRFRGSAEFITSVVARVLAAHVETPGAAVQQIARIRLVDGTTISEPGSAGADWRVHLGFDLRAQRISSLELTPSSEGESLTRVAPEPGELLIADRGYARTRGLKWVADNKAYFLVRIPWNNLTIQTLAHEPFDLFGWLAQSPEAQPIETSVRVRGVADPLRLMALRKTEPATAKTRTKILQYATNHTKSTDARTLEAAGFTLLITNKPAEELSAEAAFDLYRFRWQIELCFKKMKSIGFLAQLPAKDAHLAKMILASKLLGALLIEQLAERYVSFSPWGYALGEPAHLPLASVQDDGSGGANVHSDSARAARA